MGVGPDDQLARESVILQHDLVHDPGARSPEARVIFGRGAAQELVDLGVLSERLREIRWRGAARLDQVIAMDAHRNR